MSQTRICRECRRDLPVSRLHFKQVYSQGYSVTDTVCLDCRKRIGSRWWDVLHNNVSLEPMVIPTIEPEKFPDDEPEL